MDGVQRILVLSFTARMRNASRGREAPEEWASLSLFLFLFLALLSLLLPLGARAMNVAQSAPRLPQPEVIDKSSPEYQAAQGFENQFVEQMVKEMRKSVHEDPEIANTPGHQIFQSWQDEQYANTITQTQGIGLAELIVRQLHEKEADARQYRAMRLRALNKSDVIRK